MPQGKLGIRFAHLGDLDECYLFVPQGGGGANRYILLESTVDNDDFLELESSTDNVLLESA